MKAPIVTCAVCGQPVERVYPLQTRITGKLQRIRWVGRCCLPPADDEQSQPEEDAA